MTTEAPRHQPSLRVPGLGRALLVTFAIGMVASGLAASTAGRPQVVGAIIGAAMVAGFFLLGMVNTALAAALAPGTALVVALLTYLVQVVVLGLVLVALFRSGATVHDVDVRWLAGTVIVGALAWSVTLVLDALRTPTEPPAKITPEGVVRG